ncbi:MAG: phosphatase PAP2 family protein [Cellvibrionales bacterium]|nr:phosphatase PAP2 family protein [Cellvibrionales bacterium]
MKSNLLALDTSIYLFLVRLQTKRSIVQCFRAFSFTGDGYFYPLIGLGLVFLDPSVHVLFAFSVITAFLIEVPLFISLKKTFKRDRPFQALSTTYQLITPSDEFSFPSGHSAAAFVFATQLAFFYPAFAIAAYCWASLVALSRVILGVHYPLDIVSGALLGSFCSLFSLLFFSLI